MLKTTRYAVVHPLLKNIVKHVWILENTSALTINHTLLPVPNIDLIFNLSSPIEYVLDDVSILKGSHINGLRNKPCIIRQTGKIKVIGISFHETGLFPLLRMPLSDFLNQAVPLDQVLAEFNQRLSEKIASSSSNAEILNIIEEELAASIDLDLMAENSVLSAINVLKTQPEKPIARLCEECGISPRQLERLFNKFVGTSPKSFQRIQRFSSIIRQLENIKGKNLTWISIENDFYDQSHFLKEFKTMAGESPSEYIKHNSSVRQIITHS